MLNYALGDHVKDFDVQKEAVLIQQSNSKLNNMCQIHVTKNSVRMNYENNNIISKLYLPYNEAQHNNHKHLSDMDINMSNIDLFYTCKYVSEVRSIKM